MSIVLGLAGYLSLLVTLAVAMTVAARVTARALGSAKFRWFAEPEAPVSWPRLLAVRVVAALAPWVVSFSLFWAGLALGGTGTDAKGAWVDVIEGGPAKAAGIRNGDRVTKVDGRVVDSFEQMRGAILRDQAERFQIEVERAGQRQVLAVTPRDRKIGVSWHIAQLSPGGAAARAAAMPWQVVRAAWGSLRRTLLGWEHPQLSGPVGSVRHTAAASENGAAPLLNFLGTIAAWFWPFLAGVVVFDWFSSALFRSTHPAAVGAVLPGYRLERLRQTLILSCAGYGVVLITGILVRFEVTAALVPMLMNFPPVAAMYPLVWIIGSQFWGRSRAIFAVLAALFVPCAVFFVAYALLRRLRRALEAEGLQVRGFRTSFENVGT